MKHIITQYTFVTSLFQTFLKPHKNVDWAKCLVFLQRTAFTAPILTKLTSLNNIAWISQVLSFYLNQSRNIKITAINSVRLSLDRFSLDSRLLKNAL
jgi:hypothetical protein